MLILYKNITNLTNTKNYIEQIAIRQNKQDYIQKNEQAFYGIQACSIDSVKLLVKKKSFHLTLLFMYAMYVQNILFE